MKYCKAFGQQAWAWPGHFKPDSLLYVCVCVHVCVCVGMCAWHGNEQIYRHLNINLCVGMGVYVSDVRCGG